MNTKKGNNIKLQPPPPSEPGGSQPSSNGAHNGAAKPKLTPPQSIP
jgi:hypothetical protein